MKTTKLKLAILLGVAICFSANSTYAQKWEKTQPNILFAKDKNGNFINVKVGIGTNNPSDKLHVAGTARMFNANVDNLMQALSVSAQSANFATAAVTGQVTAGSLIVNGNASINGQLSTSNITSSSGSINFGNNNLNTTGNLSASGNLSLPNLSGTGDRVVMVDQNGVFKDFPNPCPGLNAFWKTDGNIVPLTCSPFIGTMNSVDFNIRTNNIQRMTVTATGDVGIGTTTPQSVLHISGAGDQSIQISSTLQGSETRLMSVSSNNITETQLQFINRFAFVEPLSGDLLMTILGNENVGLGTNNTTPTSTLDVLGDIEISGSRLHVDAASGNVGISTQTPAAKLDVNGNIASSSLAGIGIRTVVADANGLLSTQVAAGAQLLTLNGQVLGITGGNTVTLPPNTDNQTLSISGSTISLTNGGSVTVLPTPGDNLGNHSATQNIKLNGQRLVNTGFQGISIDNNGKTTTDNDLTVNGFATITGQVLIQSSLTVNGTCFNSTGNWVVSDTRYKKNIEELESPLEKIMKVKGMRYEYNREEFPELNFREGKTMGFIAQELKEVFPDAVMLKEDGYYAMNYDAIIPVLVEAVKEQQKMIETKDAENSYIKEELSSIKNQLTEFNASLQECCKTQQNTTGSLQNNIPNGATAYLEQNIPNPFTQNTTINYYVPAETNSASLIIFDLQGRQLKKVESLSKGKGSVTINGGELYAGMFIYALIVDGKEIENKRMILTK